MCESAWIAPGSIVQERAALEVRAHELLRQERDAEALERGVAGGHQASAPDLELTAGGRPVRPGSSPRAKPIMQRWLRRSPRRVRGVPRARGRGRGDREERHARQRPGDEATRCCAERDVVAAALEVDVLGRAGDVEADLGVAPPKIADHRVEARVDHRRHRDAQLAAHGAVGLRTLASAWWTASSTMRAWR